MREFTDGDGQRWSAEVASHGRTSRYLNPKVHRPIVQFNCLTASLARRYASLPSGADSLDALADDDLLKLLGNALSH